MAARQDLHHHLELAPATTQAGSSLLHQLLPAAAVVAAPPVRFQLLRQQPAADVAVVAAAHQEHRLRPELQAAVEPAVAVAAARPLQLHHLFRVAVVAAAVATARKEIRMPITIRAEDRVWLPRKMLTSVLTWPTCKDVSNATGSHPKVMNPSALSSYSRSIPAARCQT